MSKFNFLLFILFSSSAIAALEKNIACFSSDAKKVNVKFAIIYDDDVVMSYVKYKNSKTAIPLLFSDKSITDTREGRPAEVATTWIEFIDGKINGQYTVVSQGARYYDFAYKDRNGKSLHLNENLEAYNNELSDCIWK